MAVEFADAIFRPLGQEVAADTTLWQDQAGRRLSDRVWLARQTTRDAIDRRLREAIANGDDPIQVARDLEQYLDPSLAPVRNERGRLVGPQPTGAVTRTPRGGSGSYAARRLARTEISRAFNQAALQVGELNPFVEGMQWQLSAGHDESDACDDNAHRSSRGMPRGVYRHGEFPRIPNHPQCKCVAVPYVERDTESVVAQLRRDYRLDEPGEPPPAAPGSPRFSIIRLFRAAKAFLGREAA